MKKTITSSLKKVGQAPGSLIYTGTYEQATHLVLREYTFDQLVESTPSINELNAILQTEVNSWLQVIGLSDPMALEPIKKNFRIHPLVLEDILHTEQRPKVELIEDGVVFVSLHLLQIENENLINEQVSFWVGDGYLVSFHERSSSFWSPIIQRLQDQTSHLRQYGCWYLLYSLLDLVVDRYFTVLEHYEKKLHQLTEQIMRQENYDALSDLHTLKSDLLHLKKQILPVIDIPRNLSVVLQSHPRFKPLFLQDLSDHALQVNDLTKSYLENVDSLLNLYFSLVGLRTNRTMQTLTVITLIFLPLTLIAGIYGMNFDYMPELHWTFGYPLIMGMMGMITIGILWVFKRKGWF